MSHPRPDEADRRRHPDRRRQPTRAWDVFVTPGRRRAIRRAEGPGAPRCPIVDRHGTGARLLVILVLVLTLADGVLTVLIVASPREELNPFLARLLACGPPWFFGGKYLLTALGLAVFLTLKHYRLFGTRLRVGHFIPLLAGLYLVLLAYQIALLRCPWVFARLAEPAARASRYPGRGAPP